MITATPDARRGRQPHERLLTEVEADPEELVWGIIACADHASPGEQGLMWPHAGRMTWLTPPPLRVFTAGYLPKPVHVPLVPAPLASAFLALLHGVKSAN